MVPNNVVPAAPAFKSVRALGHVAWWQAAPFRTQLSTTMQKDSLGPRAVTVQLDDSCGSVTLCQRFTVK